MPEPDEGINYYWSPVLTRHLCPMQRLVNGEARSVGWSGSEEPFRGTVGECRHCGRLWYVGWDMSDEGDGVCWKPLRWYHWRLHRQWKNWEAMS